MSLIIETSLMRKTPWAWARTEALARPSSIGAVAAQIDHRICYCSIKVVVQHCLGNQSIRLTSVVNGLSSAIDRLERRILGMCIRPFDWVGKHRIAVCVSYATSILWQIQIRILMGVLGPFKVFCYDLLNLLYTFCGRGVQWVTCTEQTVAV